MDLFAGAGFAGATRESCVFPASDLLFRRCRGEKPVYTGEGARERRRHEGGWTCATDCESIYAGGSKSTGMSLRQEQEHQIDLATALGEDVPDVSGARSRR